MDEEAAYRALSSRDRRFDGQLWFGVVTTGVYCRPVCPAQTPKRGNVRFFAAPAAAVSAGFRACRRCRPDSVPGSREWDHTNDLVGRALRHIADGLVDDVGVAGLAERLHVSERHLHRTLVERVGVGPLDIAVSRRAQTARMLLEQTAMSVGDIAFAAGFSSVRQFNDVMRREFGATPSALRRMAGAMVPAREPTLTLRLRTRLPIAMPALGRFLQLRTVAGLERHVDGAAWRHERLVRVSEHVAHIGIASGPECVVLTCSGVAVSDIAAVVARVRRWLDLDAVPAQVADVLLADPFMRPEVDRCPGLRVPTTVDSWETCLRAVLGQQVTLTGGLTLLARFVERFAPAGDAEIDGLRMAPPAAAVAELDPARIAAIGIPLGRARALRDLAEAVASGVVDLDAERSSVLERMRRITGIGPWTTDYLALRAFGDPDAFPVTDIGIRRGAEQIGLSGATSTLLAHAERWRPWRAYAAQYLWDAAGRTSSGVRANRKSKRTKET